METGRIKNVLATPVISRGNMKKNEPLSDDICFHELMDNTADSIYFKDRQCRILRASRKLALSLGFSDSRVIIGKTDIELFGEEFGQKTMRDDMKIMETGQPIIGVVENRRLENGQFNWTLTTKFPIHDNTGSVIGLMGITREINELKMIEADLQKLATHDWLTGLPNRYLMNDRLNQILVRSQRYNLTSAILYIDLDGFKSINDTYGHDFGDLVLRAVAERLTKCVRVSDTVSRFGGDEFVIILEVIRQREDAKIVTQKIRRAISRSLILQKHRIKITASIGISLFPQDGREAETLIKIADNAMYLEKKDH
jgi:diguanylate cyclase (GGDEF)-like protein/PAS domain S-box-containing protein